MRDDSGVGGAADSVLLGNEIISEVQSAHGAAQDPPLAVPTVEARPHIIQLGPPFRWQLQQVAADFMTVFLAGMLTYWIYLRSGFGEQHTAPWLYTQLNLMFALVTVFALHVAGAYRNSMGLLRIEAVRLVLVVVSSSLLLLLALSFLLKVPSPSRLTVLMLWPLVIMALVAQRFVLWAAQEKTRVPRRDSTPVLIYGAGETGRLLAQGLMQEHHIGLDPVGFLDDDKSRFGKKVKVGPGVEGWRIQVLGDVENLEAHMAKTGAGAVFLAMPSASPMRIAELVSQLESQEIPCFFIPSAGEILFSGLQFGQVAGMPMFTRRRPTASRAYETAKRIVDVVVAGLTFVLTLPILGVASLLVKLTSPGPVMFSQTRIGKNGQPFTIHKLRTMHQSAPRYALHPECPNDDRVFRIGRVLRQLSIDEIPQLWNVLRGEMSLVGPRPEMPFVVAQYNDIQKQRLTVKPGISGPWQISEDRAYNIHDNIHYDLYYVESRSLSLDLAVLFMTPFVVLSRRGAK